MYFDYQIHLCSVNVHNLLYVSISHHYNPLGDKSPNKSGLAKQQTDTITFSVQTE